MTKVSFKAVHKRLAPRLIRCRTEAVRNQMIKDLYYTGIAVSDYDIEDAAYKMVKRKLHGEMHTFLTNLAAFIKKNKRAGSSREINPKAGEKASTDGTYWMRLGVTRIYDRVREGKQTVNRYTITPFGRQLLRGDVTIPKEFVYITYKDDMIVVAVSRSRIAWQSLEGEKPSRPKTWREKDAPDFRMVKLRKRKS